MEFKNIYGAYRRELEILVDIYLKTGDFTLNDCIKNKFVVSIYLDINTRFYFVFDPNEICQYSV